MKYLKSVVIGCLIGYSLWGIIAKAQIAPQTPTQAQRLEELQCRKNADFMTKISYKSVPLGFMLQNVEPEYHPVLFFIYDHKLEPAQTYWFTYGYCMSFATAGKAKV